MTATQRFECLLMTVLISQANMNFNDFDTLKFCVVHTCNPGACCFVSRMENRTLQHLPSVNWTYCVTTQVAITWLLHKNVHWTLMGFTRGVPIAHYKVKVKKVRFESFLSVPVYAKDMREWEAAESCLCFNPANWFAISKHQTWRRLVQPLCQLMCNFVSMTVSPTSLTFTQKPPPPPPYHHHAGAQKVLKMLSSCTHMNTRMNGGQEHMDDQLIFASVCMWHYTRFESV